MEKKNFELDDIDFEFESLEDNQDSETETIITEKIRRQRSNSWLIILLAISTIAAAALCVFLIDRNDHLRKELYERTDKPKDAVETTADPAEIVFTQDEVDEYVRRAANVEHEEMLRSIMELVDTQGTLTMLRELFNGQYLIISADGKYNFIPELQNIARHNLVSEQLIQNENGDFEYYENSVVVSHKGVDVSRYQGNIDWTKVAADGVEFAFVRLGLRGYGTGKIVLDSNYEANMNGAAAVGMDLGVYFYSQAINDDEILEEANFVIDNLEGYSINLPVVLDMEYVTGDDGRANALSQEDRTRLAIKFCEAIEEAGYKVMIYGNMRTFLMMLDLTQLEPYSKWFAYYNLPIYYPYDFDMLQYSESGSVNGIKEKCDLNIIIGDYPW